MHQNTNAILLYIIHVNRDNYGIPNAQPPRRKAHSFTRPFIPYHSHPSGLILTSAQALSETACSDSSAPPQRYSGASCSTPRTAFRSSAAASSGSGLYPSRARRRGPWCSRRFSRSAASAAAPPAPCPRAAACPTRRCRRSRWAAGSP